MRVKGEGGEVGQGLKGNFALVRHHSLAFTSKTQIPDEAQEAFAFLSTILKESLTPDLKECVIGSGGKTVGYLAHGTATDYMYQVG